MRIPQIPSTLASHGIGRQSIEPYQGPPGTSRSPAHDGLARRLLKAAVLDHNEDVLADRDGEDRVLKTCSPHPEEPAQRASRRAGQAFPSFETAPSGPP